MGYLLPDPAWRLPPVAVDPRATARHRPLIEIAQSLHRYYGGGLRAVPVGIPTEEPQMLVINHFGFSVAALRYVHLDRRRAVRITGTIDGDTMPGCLTAPTMTFKSIRTALRALKQRSIYEELELDGCWFAGSSGWLGRRMTHVATTFVDRVMPDISREPEFEDRCLERAAIMFRAPKWMLIEFPSHIVVFAVKPEGMLDAVSRALFRNTVPVVYLDHDMTIAPSIDHLPPSIRASVRYSAVEFLARRAAYFPRARGLSIASIFDHTEDLSIDGGWMGYRMHEHASRWIILNRY